MDREKKFRVAQEYFLSRLQDLSETRTVYSAIRSKQYFLFSTISFLGSNLTQGKLGVALVDPGPVSPQLLGIPLAGGKRTHCLLLGVDDLVMASLANAFDREEVDLDFDKRLSKAALQYSWLKQYPQESAFFDQASKEVLAVFSVYFSYKTEFRFLDPEQVKIDFSWAL